MKNFCMHIMCTTPHIRLVPLHNMLLAMCAGIGAPGTLREILRGYFGDKKAPERFREDDVVKAGFITIVSRTCFPFSHTVIFKVLTPMNLFRVLA